MSLSDRERVQGERETDFLKKLLFEKNSKFPAKDKVLRILIRLSNEIVPVCSKERIVPTETPLF